MKTKRNNLRGGQYSRRKYYCYPQMTKDVIVDDFAFWGTINIFADCTVDIKFVDK